MFLLIYYSNTLYWVLAVCWASLMAQMIKNLPAVQETKVEGRFFTIWAIWVRKIPWRRKWQPAPVFLPGEFYGQRSLLGYSPWDCKESDTSELITLCCILDTRIFKNEQHLHPACYHVHRNVQWKYETGNELKIKFLVYKLVPMENIDISQLLVTSKLCFGYFPWNLLVISLTWLKSDLETPL